MTDTALQVALPTLHLRTFSAGADSDELPLVLIHGWGADSTIFDPLIERLNKNRTVIAVDLPGFGGSEPWDDIELPALLETLAHQLPATFSLLGWSLGGMIATAFTARFPQRVSKLITLATNASFVVRRGRENSWKAAMPSRTYRDFCGFFDTDPTACLKQFYGLESQGDKEQRQLMKALRRQLPHQTNANWRRALALLGEIDNRQAFAGLSVPGLHLFGAEDALVPAVAAEALTELNASQQVDVIPDTSHAFHISAESQVCERLESFLTDTLLDKRRVAESFSRAATSYDGAAAFQRRIGDRLLAQVPESLQPAMVLDVGCGTGYLTRALAERFPEGQLTGFDLAPGMLAYARSQSGGIQRWVCGDAEALPMADATVDLVTSNLAYQWCEHPLRWGSELRRILREGGTARFTTFAPNTLHELREAWSKVDDFVHVNRFIEPQRLQGELEQSGLQCELKVERHVLTYPDLRALMRELKELGAHNINHGQNSGLTGRQRLRKLTDAYESFRDDDGNLPATYDVIYGVVRVK